MLSSLLNAVVTLWRFSWRFIPIDVIVMIRELSGLLAGGSGRIGESRRGTGSGGDCFKMFKTVRVNRRESRVVSLLDGSLTQS